MGRPPHHPPRVAIAHDYLTQRGGAERVVLAMARAFPQAPIYTTLYEPDGTFAEFRRHDVRTSWLNSVRPLRRDHRQALPLLPAASSTVRIDADVVLASSSGWAHGFRTAGRKVVYCHNPARWLYQAEQYLGADASRAKRTVLRVLDRPLRRWDSAAAATADVYLANSTVVRDRVQRTYGLVAEVLHPPAGVDAGGTQEPVASVRPWAEDGAGFLLVVSRLLPYKNVDEVIRAVESGSERLVVVGRGPERERLSMLAGPRVQLLEGLPDEQMRWLYAHARALVAPSHEDFGLTPIEAGSFGTPVVALRDGGYLDTVAEGVSGVFFDDPTPESIREGLERLGEVGWDPEAVRQHAWTFSEERFVQRLREIVLS